MHYNALKNTIFIIGANVVAGIVGGVIGGYIGGLMPTEVIANVEVVSDGASTASSSTSIF